MMLDGASPRVTFQPWVRNSTTAGQNFQFWLNAMLAFNNNSISGNTEIIIPAEKVIVHSTGDNRLPGEWAWMAWPVYNGIDLSLYNTWQGWLGFFAPQVTNGFTSVYDHHVEQGVVRIYNPGWPVGTKIFGPGTLPSYLWTDDNSSYIELWSGITATFAEEMTLSAGAQTGWTEYWYPVHDLGGVTAATSQGALMVKTGDGIVDIGALAAHGTAQSLTLWQNSVQVQTWDIYLAPGQAFRTQVPLASSHNLGLSMVDAANNIMVQWGAVP